MKNFICHNCNISGHLASVCKEKIKEKVVRTKKINFVSSNVKKEKNKEICEDYSDSFVDLFNIRDEMSEWPIDLEIKVNNKLVQMQIDSGSAISAFSEDFYLNNFSYVKLNKNELKLRGYSGESLPILGCMDSLVKFNNIESKI